MPCNHLLHHPQETAVVSRLHIENHSAHRVGWLRAAVLGANDGLVSTASLIVCVAASAAATGQVMLAGTAGLVAGAMSMAAGEYVSVSSQSDTEAADLARETRELREQPQFELNELAQSFVDRGVSSKTALQVARELTASDALAAHAREELGISDMTTARPIQAALVSALTFAVGAVAPLLVVVLTPSAYVLYAVAISTVVFLAVLGAMGAKAGGANILRGTVRVTFWGVVAMAITAAVGTMFGAVV